MTQSNGRITIEAMMPPPACDDSDLGLIITSYSIHYTKLYEALDVTIQAQILELLKSLQERLNMALLLITHDLGVVEKVCERVSYNFV